MSKKCRCLLVLIGVIVGILITRDPRDKKKMFIVGPYWLSIRIVIPPYHYSHRLLFYKETVSAGRVFASEAVLYLLQKVLINIGWGRRSCRFTRPPGPVYLGADYPEWCRIYQLRRECGRKND